MTMRSRVMSVLATTLILVVPIPHMINDLIRL